MAGLGWGGLDGARLNGLVKGMMSDDRILVKSITRKPLSSWNEYEEKAMRKIQAKYPRIWADLQGEMANKTARKETGQTSSPKAPGEGGKPTNTTIPTAGAKPEMPPSGQRSITTAPAKTTAPIQNTASTSTTVPAKTTVVDTGNILEPPSPTVVPKGTEWPKASLSRDHTILLNKAARVLTNHGSKLPESLRKRYISLAKTNLKPLPDYALAKGVAKHPLGWGWRSHRDLARAFFLMTLFGEERFRKSEFGKWIAKTWDWTPALTSTPAQEIIEKNENAAEMADRGYKAAKKVISDSDSDYLNGQDSDYSEDPVPVPAYSPPPRKRRAVLRSASPAKNIDPSNNGTSLASAKQTERDPAGLTLPSLGRVPDGSGNTRQADQLFLGTITADINELKGTLEAVKAHVKYDINQLTNRARGHDDRLEDIESRIQESALTRSTQEQTLDVVRSSHETMQKDIARLVDENKELRQKNSELERCVKSRDRDISDMKPKLERLAAFLDSKW